MRYLLMIFGEETDPSQVSPEEWGAVMAEWNGYTAMLRERGAYLAGEALQNSDTATTVKVRNAETLTTDGPFIESKEQFGGYYLVQARDLDEAIEFAAACPGARYGAMEVRPVMEFPAEEASATPSGEGASSA